MIKFTVKEVSERPMAYFEDEPSPKNWLLSFFLEDSRFNIDGRLQEIVKAETGENVPTGITGNHVDIEFYADRAVIEELYPADEDNYQKVEIPLQEAKNLLLDWKKVIEEWESKGEKV